MSIISVKDKKKSLTDNSLLISLINLRILCYASQKMTIVNKNDMYSPH